jgi:hypothetical protein
VKSEKFPPRADQPQAEKRKVQSVKFSPLVEKLKIQILIVIIFIAFSVTVHAQEEITQEQAGLPEQSVVVNEEVKAEIVPVILAVEVGSLLWVDDSLPEGAIIEGKWNWSEKIKYSGKLSHVSDIKKGLHFHSFKIANPITLKKGSIIAQYVYLDPQNPPKGIMLKIFTVDEDKTIDLYWEAEEEVFVDTVEYMEAWYMGFLPKTGAWQKLEIKMKELELAPIDIIGISFICYNGRAYWDRTVIKG